MDVNSHHEIASAIITFKLGEVGKEDGCRKYRPALYMGYQLKQLLEEL